VRLNLIRALLALFALCVSCSAFADNHADRQDAYEHCMAQTSAGANAVFAQVRDAHPGYSTSWDDSPYCSAEGSPGHYVGRAKFHWDNTCCGPAVPVYTNYEHPEWHFWTQECPDGSTWNPDTHTCSAPCANLPPLTGGWAVTGAEVCSGGCAYAPVPGGIFAFKKIDGISYWGTSGWAPTGGTCGVPTVADPPPDRDGDGVSDGLDGAPDNPGDTGGKDPPEDPPDGDGDGKPDCGGSGQAQCPDKTDPNNHQSSGGGNCSSPPVSSGDEILAQIAYQTWATRCAVTGDANANNGSGSGSGDAPDYTTPLNNIAGNINTTNSLLGDVNTKLSGPIKTTSGTAAGGESCALAPTCSEGDQVECHVMLQMWLLRCGEDGGTVGSAESEAHAEVGLLLAAWDNESQSFGDAYADYRAAVEASSQSVKESNDDAGDIASLDADGFLGGGQCPEPTSVTIKGTTIHIPWTNFCSLLQWFGLLVVAGAYFRAAKIIAVG